VGQAPMAHVKDMRMYVAATELAATAERVTAVAEMVGYKSEKAFSRAFKQWSGVAPTTYARRSSSPTDSVEPLPV
jgi:AraC-like DNA-binding protein